MSEKPESYIYIQKGKVSRVYSLDMIAMIGNDPTVFLTELYIMYDALDKDEDVFMLDGRKGSWFSFSIDDLWWETSMSRYSMQQAIRALKCLGLLTTLGSLDASSFYIRLNIENFKKLLNKLDLQMIRPF